MRRVHHLCFCRDDAHWIGCSEEFGQVCANSLLEHKSSDSTNNACQSKINLIDLTPEQRSVLGFPCVDSKHWNKQTIRDASLMHEGALDLSSCGKRR